MLHFFFTSVAYAQETGAGAKGMIASFIPFAVLILIFYFLLIRPQQKGAKKQREMLTKLQKGDIVVTSSGIHGKISGVKDDTVTLEIADNVRIKLEKSAVQALKGSEAPQ